MGKSPIGLDLWYEISVHDIKTGKLVRHKKSRCYSFVQQFVYLLKLSMAGNVGVQVTDTGGTARTLSPSNIGNNFKLNALITDATFGTVVGSGTNAAAVTDTDLQTLIAHGTSSGQLQYSAVSFGAPTTDSSTTSFIVTRVFTNGSGGTVTVNEIGLVCIAYGTDNNIRNFLIVRDIPTPITILNSQALTLNYTFKTTI